MLLAIARRGPLLERVERCRERIDRMRTPGADDVRPDFTENDVQLAIREGNTTTLFAALEVGNDALHEAEELELGGAAWNARR